MINKLKELLEAATPGPWSRDNENTYIFGGGFEMVAEMRGYGANLPMEANQDLIVAMRNCLPELLAVCEAAEHVLDKARTDPNGNWFLMDLKHNGPIDGLHSALAALAKKVGEG